LFRQAFGVINPQQKAVGFRIGAVQNANLRIAFDTSKLKDYKNSRSEQYGEFMDVAHTIVHETTHYMNDRIEDYNYFFFYA
jgi:predicted Zn-dependent protease with MMP-like domain